MILIIIGSVAIFIAGIALTCFSLCKNVDNKKLRDTCDIIAKTFTAFGVCCVVLGLFIYNINIPQRLNTKEYPASEYELKYKIIDYDGKSDTTYVLIPIKLKEQQEKTQKAIKEERMRNKY